MLTHSGHHSLNWADDLCSRGTIEVGKLKDAPQQHTRTVLLLVSKKFVHDDQDIGKTLKNQLATRLVDTGHRFGLIEEKHTHTHTDVWSKQRQFKLQFFSFLMPSQMI